MSDSPICRVCHKDGNFGQTYKVAGKPLFRCQRCKSIFFKDDFKLIEFEWRTKRLEHAEFMSELRKPKKEGKEKAVA